MPARATRIALSLLSLAIVCGSAVAQDPLRIVQNGKYGFIDRQGNVVIQPNFYWADGFFNGYASVYICGRSLWVDAKGTLSLHKTSSELVVKKQGDKIGFADSSGQFKILPVYDDALHFSDGLAAVRRNGKWGFIDEQGTQVIALQYDEAFSFHEGIGLVESGNKQLIIDKSGKVLASDYESFSINAEGRIPVTLNDKSGFLDYQGKVSIPLIYDSVSNFSEGLAAVEMNKKWGYIDRDGKIVIPLQFDMAQDFGAGLAAVRQGQKTGFINTSGNFAFYLPFEYAASFMRLDKPADDVTPFWTADQKFGYVNANGQILWGPTSEMPDHWPLLGISEEGRQASCEGIPETLRAKALSFPPQPN